MNPTPGTRTQHDSIFISTMHTTPIPHHSILNNPHIENFSLLMIVEPYAYLKDEQYLTLTHQRWQLILPGPLTEAHVPPRSIIHVNTHISSMSYFITPFPSRDISLISLLIPNSQKTLTLVNIYNPQPLSQPFQPQQSSLTYTPPSLALGQPSYLWAISTYTTPSGMILP